MPTVWRCRQGHTLPMQPVAIKGAICGRCSRMASVKDARMQPVEVGVTEQEIVEQAQRDGKLTGTKVA